MRHHAGSRRLESRANRVLVFRPKRTFKWFYQAALSRLEERLAVAQLADQVRVRFVEMATQRRAGSSTQAHLRFLARQVSWAQCHTDETCLVCVMQRPSATLTCKHRLCLPCATVCSGSRSVPCAVTLCPLCQMPNDQSIEVPPPTAGSRVLALGGGTDKLTVIQFLKDLERQIGMKNYPLVKHFDAIVGSGIGMLHDACDFPF